MNIAWYHLRYGSYSGPFHACDVGVYWRSYYLPFSTSSVILPVKNTHPESHESRHCTFYKGMSGILWLHNVMHTLCVVAYMHT